MRNENHLDNSGKSGTEPTLSQAVWSGNLAHCLGLELRVGNPTSGLRATKFFMVSERFYFHIHSVLGAEGQGIDGKLTLRNNL